MVMPQLLVVAVACTPGVESVTLTVKENDPAVVGEPVMAPVEVFRVRPGGRAPPAGGEVGGGLAAGYADRRALGRADGAGGGGDALSGDSRRIDGDAAVAGG